MNLVGETMWERCMSLFFWVAVMKLLDTSLELCFSKAAGRIGSFIVGRVTGVRVWVCNVGWRFRIGFCINGARQFYI